jgi:hypothetical protein
LDIHLIRYDQIGSKEPGGKIPESSQRKFVNGIIVRNIVYGSEQIKNYDTNSKGYNKTILIGKTKKIKKILIPAGIQYFRI